MHISVSSLISYIILSFYCILILHFSVDCIFQSQLLLHIVLIHVILLFYVYSVAKPVISSSLKMLIDWVDCVSGEVVKSKQMCYQSLSDIVGITLNMFPVFVHQPGIVFVGDNYFTFSPDHLKDRLTKGQTLVLLNDLPHFPFSAAPTHTLVVRM